MNNSVNSLCSFPEYWDKHTDVQLIHWIQGKTHEEKVSADENSDFTSSASEEEDKRKVKEVSDDHGREEAEQERDSEPDDSDSDAGFGVCNKFSVLGAGE
jgi:hypothetical protein